VIRCAATSDHQLRWVKLTPATSTATAAARRVEVSTRRRLILDANTDDRDGVYLCILTDRSSVAAARLAANVTILSPCEHQQLSALTVLLTVTKPASSLLSLSPVQLTCKAF